MEIDHLQKLFLSVLQELYDGEKQSLDACVKMIAMATSHDLKHLLRDHVDETKNQIHRLEQIFRDLRVNPYGSVCLPVRGLIEEAQALVSQNIPGDLLDAGLINIALKIDYFEIVSYRTVRSYAKQLDFNFFTLLLQESLMEEEKMARDLNHLNENLVHHSNTPAAR